MRACRLSFTVPCVLFILAAAPSMLRAQAPRVHADTIARGKAIFVATCRSCHTVAPPPQAAPPMSRIAQRYVAVSGSRDAASARIAEWLLGPTVEKSLLPRDEVARYGVMPHQPLADAGRFAVAAYVVTLADLAQVARRRRPR